MNHFGRKDGLTDLVQALQSAAKNEPKTPPPPPGTVIAADGSVVTLDKHPTHTASVASTQEGTNQD